MSKIDPDTRSLIEALHRDSPLEFYVQALGLTQEIEKIFEQMPIAVMENITSPPKSVRLMGRHNPEEAILASSGLPQAAHDRLTALGHIADALDTTHAAALKALVKTCDVGMRECLLVDEIYASDLIRDLRQLAKECRTMKGVLQKKIASLDPLGGRSDEISREDALRRITTEFHRYPAGMSKEKAMNKLVDCAPVSAALLLQVDWATLLQRDVRTISGYSAWKRIDIFRKKQAEDAATQSGLPEDDEPDQKDDENVKRKSED